VTGYGEINLLAKVVAKQRRRDPELSRFPGPSLEEGLTGSLITRIANTHGNIVFKRFAIPLMRNGLVEQFSQKIPRILRAE
jgi:hypothetical protein